MFRVIVSNQPEVLLQRLCEALSGAGDPIEPAQVIVPSAAVQRRIELSLCDLHGVCANVQFDFLARWLWRRIASVVPVAKTSPFSPPVLAWRIYAQLALSQWIDQHPRLSNYLSHADPVMRLETAQRIAQLLDNYTTYRTDWLERWSAHQGSGVNWTHPDHAEDERWQAQLWRLIQDALQLNGPHPGLRYLQALHQGRRPPDLPTVLHVFNLPAIAPLHLGILKELSKFIEVRYYASNPCEQYWFDLVDPAHLARLQVQGRADHHEIGHPILAGWGGQSRVHLASVLAQTDAEGATLDDSGFLPYRTDTLLGRLQQSILELSPLGAGQARALRLDRSVEVHCCHSLTRELEVLHDRLLELLGGQRKRCLADVVVLVPDLEAAAPLIDAVFGTAPAGRYIDYGITGQPARRENRIARLLLDLLALAEGRMGATEVMGLLEQPPVMAAFQLDPNQVALIEGWIREAGIRWGADASHREALGLAANDRFSFDDGLQRLFLSYAAGDNAQPLLQKLPVASPQGQPALTLGRAWRFVQAIKECRRRWEQACSIDQWQVELHDALETFVGAGDDWDEELRRVRQSVSTMFDAMREAQLSELLPLPLIRHALSEAVEESARAAVPTGAVTFASIGSLRGLSWPVVCIIGLDDQAYPSQQTACEFDLMAAAPQAFDRQRARDERTLLLEWLLAAREHLHLSYTGRSIRDDAPLPPSVLVGELLDHLALACADDPDQAESVARARGLLVIEHPLQPFSARYFHAGPICARSAEDNEANVDQRLSSFDASYCEALKARHARHSPTSQREPRKDAAALDAPAAEIDSTLEPIFEKAESVFFCEPLPEPPAQWRDVSLEQLQAFYRNPCRVLLTDRLGIRLPRTEEALSDEEPFVLEAAGRRALAQRLIPPLLEGATAAQLQALARAGTELPDGNLAVVQLEDELRQMQAFAERLKPALAQAPQPVIPHALTVDLDGQIWRLTGQVTDLRTDVLVRWRYDAHRVTDYLDAWIAHLFACSVPQLADRLPRTEWHGREGLFTLAPCRDARTLLVDLIERYRAGLRTPLHFFPRSAWAWIEKRRASDARKAWLGQAGRRNGESRHPAYALAFRGVNDPLDERFQAHAQAIFGPLRDHLSQGDA